MARKSKAEAKRQEGFKRLREAAEFKFDTLKTLNAAIDAKAGAASSASHKLRIETNRLAAQNAKAKMVARQSYATIDEPGAGSAKGMFFDNGNRTKQVRGKEKIRKGPQAPNLGKRNGQFGKDYERA